MAPWNHKDTKKTQRHNVLVTALYLAFPLALCSLLAVIAVAAGVTTRLRILTDRIHSLESRLGDKAALPKAEPELWKPLDGLRFALSIKQDHPHPVFATLLKEALLREGALVYDGAETIIRGTLACNGYADVYFRAELLVLVEGETLLALSEKPPHGDRQENLARELVARLKAEWPKRERHGALRELSGDL